MAPETKIVSLEEFLEMDKGEDRLEHFNGEVIYLPSPSVDHQRILLNKENAYEGVPALVIEIISTSNQTHDRIRKYSTYMEFGINEYWMLNPEFKTVEIYVLEEDEYKQAAICKGSDCAAYA